MQRPTHLTPAPLLPVAEGGIGWGPFGGAVPRRASGDPRAAARASSHDVIVFTACVALVLFLVLGVAVGGAPRDVDVSSASAPREYRAGGGRKLTQFLAPVWYALPGLRDSLYNLGEAWTDFTMTPYEYQLAEDLNALAAEEAANEREMAELRAAVADAASAAGGGYEYDAYSPGDDVDVAPAAAMAPSAEEVEEKE